MHEGRLQFSLASHNMQPPSMAFTIAAFHLSSGSAEVAISVAQHAN